MAILPVPPASAEPVAKHPAPVDQIISLINPAEQQAGKDDKSIPREARYQRRHHQIACRR